MKQKNYILILIFFVLFVSNLPASADEYWVCSNETEILDNCFEVHGRISIYNGNPGIRIWVVGTNRLLGVSDAEIRSEILNSYLRFDTKIYGDFIVCPLTKYKKGVMQKVCLKFGKNLVVEQFSKDTKKTETYKLQGTWEEK